MQWVAMESKMPKIAPTYFLQYLQAARTNPIAPIHIWPNSIINSKPGYFITLPRKGQPCLYSQTFPTQDAAQHALQLQTVQYQTAHAKFQQDQI
jgi:hypothetical protein